MDFLKYIEHSAENLQFYLWYKDYEKRFSQLPESERILSPEWTQEQEEAEAATYRAQLKNKTLAAEAKDILKKQDIAETDTHVEAEKVSNHAHDGDEKSSLESASTRRPESGSGVTSARTLYSDTAKHAFED